MGAAQYKMYWDTSPGVTTDSNLATPTTTTDYGHTGVVPGWTYYYRIMAVSADGHESALSAEASATVPANAVQNCGAATTYHLPDTGQTQSYTNTFGEDHDYLINPPSYTDNHNGTVTDNVTGLIWQQQDDGQTRIWEGAIAYCEGLSLANQSDWRLPNVKELESITDDNRAYPAIDPIFAGVVAYFASYYWSSTTYAGDSYLAWFIFFDYGNVDLNYKGDYYFARCVRGGQ